MHWRITLLALLLGAGLAAQTATLEGRWIGKELSLKEIYHPRGRQTYCDRYLRDFAGQFVGRPLPELSGRPLRSCGRSRPERRSGSRSRGETLETRLEQAHRLAEEGKLVVAGWTNPKPDPAGDASSGHVAVILPGAVEASGKWGGIQVPPIAQAGDKKSIGIVKLSDGFGPDKKDALVLFVYSPSR